MQKETDKNSGQVEPKAEQGKKARERILSCTGSPSKAMGLHQGWGSMAVEFMGTNVLVKERTRNHCQLEEQV